MGVVGAISELAAHLRYGVPWDDLNVYAEALSRVLGVAVVLISGIVVYYPVRWLFGPMYAGVVFTATLVSSQQVLQISKPVLGEANRIGLQKLLGSLVAGVLGFGMAASASLGYAAIFIMLAATVFVAHFLTAAIGVASTELTDQFCTTLVVVTLYAQLAGQAGTAAIIATSTTCGMLFGVIVAMSIAVLVFPRPASVDALVQIKRALQELVNINYMTWNVITGGDGQSPSDAPDMDTLSQLNDQALASLTEGLVDVKHKLKVSRYEGYLSFGKVRMYLPCWPCQCLGPRLPRQQLLQMCQELHSTAQTLVNLYQMVAEHKQWDASSFQHINVLYSSSDRNESQLQQCQELIALVLFELARAFPNGMSPVSELCNSQWLEQLRVVQTSMEESEEKHWALVCSRVTTSGNTVVSAAPSDDTGKDSPDKRLVFQRGPRGLQTALRFSSFRYALRELLHHLDTISKLENEVLQGIPWAKINRGGV